MSLLTYFKATLPCSRCGHVETAWIPSGLGSRGATYEVGDCPADDIPPADFEDTSFRVRPVEPGQPVHLLLSWTCEECGLESFAELVFADGCVRSIDAVELEPRTLARLHYIADRLDDILQTVIGQPLYDESGLRADWLTRLQAALDAGRRWS